MKKEYNSLREGSSELPKSGWKNITILKLSGFGGDEYPKLSVFTARKIIATAEGPFTGVHLGKYFDIEAING